MKIICLYQANIRIYNVYSTSEMSFYQFTGPDTDRKQAFTIYIYMFRPLANQTKYLVYIL